MSKNHFLPATYIARFSDDITYPRRDRKLFVGNKKNKRIFKTTSDNICSQNDLYFVKTVDGNEFDLDSVWYGYEANLNKSINDLIYKKINAYDWLRYLVPFVSCQLIRGRDFIARYYERIRPYLDYLKIKEEMQIDETYQINSARIMELQLLLAPILTAHWLVLSKTGYDPVINNDVGYIPYKDAPHNAIGLSIPLDTKNILALVSCKERVIVRVEDNKWLPNIEYFKLDHNNHCKFNEKISFYAENLIYGSTERVVKKYLPVPSSTAMMVEPFQVGLLHNALTNHANEFTWHYLVSALTKTPDQISRDGIDHNFDFEVLKRDWCPPILLPTNLPKFPNTIFYSNDSIAVHLLDVKQEGDNFIIW